MKEYHKIETVFERSMDGSKKLIEGVYRNEAVEFLKDNEWEFTEKIDGTNIRVYWDGHKVFFAGRTDKADIPKHLLEKLKEMFDGEENAQIFEQKFSDSEVILFGEGYGPKIQNGGLYRDDVSFILFDVKIGNFYLRRKDVEDIARAFNIDVVPIIMNGTIQDAVDFVKTKPKSTIGKANMEGLVGRPKVEMYDRMGRRMIVKVKVKDFC